MKHLREICCAVVLTYVLAATSFAGEMDIPVASPPPPPATSNISRQATANSVTEVTLDLLKSVLLLF